MARDFDPWGGRYTEADPICLRAGPNLYLYVGGNPISRTDPLGLVPIGTIPDDPNQAALFYNFPRRQNQPTSSCACPPSISLTPGQAIGGSMLGLGGIGAATGLGLGLAATGAEVGEAVGMIGTAGALAVAGKATVTGLVLGSAAGAVAGLTIAGVIVASTPSSNSCPAQCPPCP